MKKPTKKDIGYATAKAIVGSIPLAGAAAAELLGLLVASPLEKRREALLTEIGERLKSLEEEDRIDLASLQEDPLFVDVVLQAALLALKTSEREKIEAFKNAILNTAKGESPDSAKSQIFLNCIDSFTSWHIRLLSLFDNPKTWFEQNEKTPPRFLMGSLSLLIKAAYPELGEDGELMDLVWSDLHRAGFHRTGDIKTTMSGDGILASRTSDLGKEFLQFIQAS